MKKTFKRSRLFFGILALVLATVITFIIAPLVDREINGKEKVVVANRIIERGKVIETKDVSYKTVGKLGLNSNIAKDINTVIGKVADHEILDDEMIRLDKIKSDKEIIDDVFAGGKKLMSITVNTNAQGVAGNIKQGDIISIVASNFGDDKETIVPEELRYIEVMGVNYEQDRYDENVNQKISNLTLRVIDTQAQLLKEIEDNANIHVLLTYRGTREESKKFLDAQEEYFEKQKPEDEEISDADNEELINTKKETLIDEN